MSAPIGLLPDTMTCVVCERVGPAFRWTDTHGIGACTDCGTPYRILHYEGELGARRRVAKPPACLIKPDWLPLVRRYWTEQHRNVDPGAFNFGGSSYEVATREDFEVYDAWMQAHEAEWPQPPAPAEPGAGR